MLSDEEEDESFIFTGHSKGGVFAQIAGITALGTSARQRASVIAYGVPPIFSADGASVVNNMSHAFLRVSKENDIVVNYADSGPKGYNGGSLYSISQLDSDIVMTGDDSDYTVPTRAEFMTGIQTHKMPGYLQSVESLTLEECLR